MPVANIAYDYVENIPWDKDPNFAPMKEAVAYERAFHNVFGEIPTRDLKINFEDDIWDFNPYFRNCTRPENRVDFTIAPAEIKSMLKFFVLHRLSAGNKVSTVNVRLWSFVGIVNRIIKKTRHKRISVITTQDVIDEIEGRMVAPATAYNLYEGAYQVYSFLIYNCKRELPVDTDELKALGIKAKETAKSEDSKFPNIPDELFVAIRDTAVKVMRDVNAPHNDRVTAAVIAILSQSGFRIGDMLTLEVDQILEKKLAKSGLITHFIHYKAEKPSKPHDEMKEFDVFCNNLSYEAADILKTLRMGVDRDDDIGKWLIVYGKGGSKNKKASKYAILPTTASTFRQHYYEFLYKYCYDYVSREWEGIPIRKIYCYNPETQKNETVEISAPDTRQFRVRVCSDLYLRGVPLVFIQRFMGHLSEYMLGYYVRPKDHSQENAEYTAKFIREIENEGLSILGHNEGPVIIERIKAFISEGNYNVDTDMDRLLKDLGDKLVIRGKEGGVCVKTSILPCSKDARTNEVFCAAGVCPNLYHLYYMIDVTYNDFLALQKTYKTAGEAGRTAESKKEYNKIKNLVRNKLLPELNELEVQILKRGASAVISDHPELIDIIDIKDEIRHEAEKWLTHKYYNIADSYEKCKAREKHLDEVIRTGTEEEILEEKRLFRDYIERGLVMELGDLSVQIKKFGKDEVIRRHPELKDAIENIEGLKKDLRAWQEKAPRQTKK